MPTDPLSEPETPLHALLRDVDAAVLAATRHAAGEVDAQAFAAACERLARAFVEHRPALLASAQGLPAPLLQQLGQRLQTLHELHARLSAQARGALAALLPQDTLQEYARLGSRLRGPWRP